MLCKKVIMVIYVAFELEQQSGHIINLCQAVSVYSVWTGSKGRGEVSNKPA